MLLFVGIGVLLFVIVFEVWFVIVEEMVELVIFVIEFVGIVLFLDVKFSGGS